LKETAETKDVKQFYDLMKRVSPKFYLIVNSGSQGEESIASQLVQLEPDPCYAGLVGAVPVERFQLNGERQTPDPGWTTSPS